jgi:hypothetical protein
MIVGRKSPEGELGRQLKWSFQSKRMRNSWGSPGLKSRKMETGDGVGWRLMINKGSLSQGVNSCCGCSFGWTGVFRRPQGSSRLTFLVSELFCDGHVGPLAWAIFQYYSPHRVRKLRGCGVVSTWILCSPSRPRTETEILEFPAPEIFSPLVKPAWASSWMCPTKSWPCHVCTHLGLKVDKWCLCAGCMCGWSLDVQPGMSLSVHMRGYSFSLSLSLFLSLS